jgi:beta-glucosidase
MKTRPALLLAAALAAGVQAAPRAFPDGFFWGTATAAHQVEGNNVHSDWWRWEQQEGHHRSGAAADHWNRYPEDLDMARGLASNAYRFSVEWARIEPVEGSFDEAALEHYRDVVAACRARGVEPFVTLYHFTLPAWFVDRGGWTDPGSVALFERYVRRVAAALGEHVRYWCTINEPVVYSAAAYMGGVFPPEATDPEATADVLENLMRAHGAAFHALHEVDEDAAVGLAKHLRIFDPGQVLDPRDRIAAWRVGKLFNQLFLDGVTRGKVSLAIPGAETRKFSDPALRDSLDWLGINYYSRDMVHYDASAQGSVRMETRAGAPTTDLGWEIYPEGFTRILKWAKRYGKPIYVTENGLADGDDDQREDFLRDHLGALHEAIRRGVDVRGYFHWSLLDNFEWHEGFGPRFGLLAVDYATQRRSRRGSAALFEWVARENRLPPDP